MTGFDLRALVREVCDGSDSPDPTMLAKSPDPTMLAKEVNRRIKKTERDAALEQARADAVHAVECTITRRKRMAHRGIPDIKVVAEQLAEAEEGRFLLGFHKGQWCAAIEWGQEADDSPMAAATAYGVGATARETIEAVVRKAGWS